MEDLWNCRERPLALRKAYSAGGDGSEFRDVLLSTLLETLRRADNVAY